MNLIKSNRLNVFQNFGSLFALVILVVVISIIRPEFRTIWNFLSILRQSSINGLIAFGMTGVILVGAIDLSVGSVLALSSILCAGMIAAGVDVPVAFALTLMLGTAMGFISGMLVTAGRLQPFIATLVTMVVYRGLTLIFSQGRPISNLGDDALLVGLGRGSFLGVPIPVWILGITFAIYLFILNKTTLGRQIYGTGSNIAAAAISGVRVNRIKIIVYSICGFFASLAGLILLSRLGSAQPTIGTGFELDAIAAVVLGGTSMSGGRGKLYGTLIGVLIIAVLNNGMNIIGVQSFFQDVVKGLVILIAVLLDRKR